MSKQWDELNRQDFADLYKTMNGVQIADRYGVTPGAVYYKMKVFGLSAHRASRKFDPPKEELASMYERMSMKEIGNRYGVGETVVFMRLKEHGIGGISRSDRLSGKPKTIEHRLAMSRSARASGVRSGEKNGNWKGGKTSANTGARSKTAYFEWKASVLANAGWKCQVCGKSHGEVCKCCGHRTLLHAHHVIPFSENQELRYEPTNGRALCERCHWEVHH